MARPLKRTVDYFPHFVNEGETLFILQNQFGNDGYSFWFRLLSFLCAKENLFYKMENPFYLASINHISSEKCIKIIDTLAELNAIDRELWNSDRIIWVESLIDNLSDVFKRRKTPIPKRPQIKGSENNNPVNVNINPVSRHKLN